MPGESIVAGLYENKMDVIYPQVENLSEKAVEKRINHVIKRQINDLVPKVAGDEMDVMVRSEPKVNRKGVLSIRTEVYTYIRHYAHGLTVVRSLSCDLTNGEVYELGDLFKKGSQYVETLSAIIKEQIKEKQIPLIKDFERISYDQPYYLTPDYLVIYFQLYEYTPYYVGIPEFPIPYSSIMGIINPRGVIAKLLDP